MKQLQHDTMKILDAVTNSSRKHDWAFPDYACVRTVEFLLLVRRLMGFGDFHPRRMLEIGCGGGYSLRLWSQVVSDVVGVDLPSETERAKRFLQDFPASGRVTLESTTGEQLCGVDGAFDLILTQYVLEHVDDMDVTLRNLRKHLAPGGLVVHVLNNAVDRHNSYVAYRSRSPLYKRLYHSFKFGGVLATLLSPFSFTLPHEQKFGSFLHELANYRLESWSLRILRQGYEIVDWFQTRDNNWVIVSKALTGP